VPAHLVLKGLTPAYFRQWLGLFRSTLQDLAASETVVAFFH